MLKTLTLNDKNTFDSFLGHGRHELSAYAFSALFSWRGLYDISWCIIDANLCVFFTDAVGCFAALPPLGPLPTTKTVKGCFGVMDSRNRNPAVSRIENVEETDQAHYRAMGYVLTEKSRDYLCSCRELCELAGDRYKSKRACVNYFVKHYPFELRPYERKWKEDCLRLYRSWKGQRTRISSEKIFLGMLEDSFSAFEQMLEGFERLELEGLLVFVGKKLVACTFGYAVSPAVFCVWFEISDLEYKGAAQFIFQQFCLAHAGYSRINIMDDSGLPNLSAVKRSYHPVKMAASYNVQR